MLDAQSNWVNQVTIDHGRKRVKFNISSNVKPNRELLSHITPHWIFVFIDYCANDMLIYCHISPQRLRDVYKHVFTL